MRRMNYIIIYLLLSKRLNNSRKNAVQQIYNPKMYSSNQSSSQININQKGKENIYERPSTAPSKNDIKPVPGTMSSIPISNSTVLKRLPSPNVKCIFLQLYS